MTERVSRMAPSNESNRLDVGRLPTRESRDVEAPRLEETIRRAASASLPTSATPKTRVRRATGAASVVNDLAGASRRIQHSAARGGVIIQRRLMPYAAFTRGKAAAVDGRRGIASTKDITGIYLKYHHYARFKQWAQALVQLDSLESKLTRMEAKKYWIDDERRDEFLDAVRDSIEEERTWIRTQTAPDPLTPDTPQSLGTTTDAVIPLAERRVVTLTMSQGVVADLRQLSFHSHDFSSCSPLAMYNEATHRGGLFHFPGSGLSGSDRDDTARRLKQMHDDVAPTKIWVNSRAILIAEGLPMDPNDVGPITDFLRDEAGYVGEITEIAKASGAYSFYLDGLDQPVAASGVIPGVDGGGISVMQDRTRDERSALADRWSDLPAATKFGIDEYSHLGTTGSY